MNRSARCHGEHGQVGGIEALPFGVLIFVLGSLLIANAWAVIDAKFATDTAARQATRTYVEGSDPEVALAEAVAAGRAAVAGHGRDPDRVEIAPIGAAGLARCVARDVRGGVRGARPQPPAHRRLRAGALRGAVDAQRAGRSLPRRAPRRGRGLHVSGDRAAPQRASVLMLVPAGLLVTFLLAAICFDLSLLFLRQRQASSVAVDVANDLASAAFDEDLFRATGRFELDAARAEGLARTYLDASDLAGQVEDVEVSVLGQDRVRVRVTVRVEYVFARAIPGAADGSSVTAAATAIAATG